MFARSATNSTRNGVGYVCLACRHERALSARQNPQQRRWNSESNKASSTNTRGRGSLEEQVDDWLLPLNSFSQDFGDEIPPPVKKEPSTKPSRKKDLSLDDLARSLLDRIDGDGDGGAQKKESSSRQHRKQRREEQRRAALKSMTGGVKAPLDVAGLLKTLDQANGGKYGSGDIFQKARETTKSGKSREKSSPSDSRPQITTKTSNPEMQALWDSLGPEIQAEIDELAAERDRVDNEAHYDEYLEKSAAVAPPNPEVKSTEPVAFPSFSSTSGESNKASTPSKGFFSSTLNYFKESFGLSKSSRQPSHSSSPSQDAQQSEQDIQAQSKRASDVGTSSTKQKRSVARNFDSIELPRNVTVQKSPVERYEESRDRSPWGTKPSARDAPDSRVASFEDIASADRISVKKPVATKFSARPFGSEPANTLAGLRGKLAENLTKDQMSPKSDAAAVDKTSEAAASSTAEEGGLKEATPAHSRLSDLYAARNDNQEANATPSVDGQDTHDLAYLRRQHDQDRAQEDVKESIRKAFPGLPISGSEVDDAAKEEAARALEGKSRVSQKAMSGASNRDVSVEDKTAFSDVPVEGFSLGAAMRAAPKPATSTSTSKRRVGRPARGNAASRAKSRVEVEKTEPEESQTSLQELAPSDKPAVETKTNVDTAEEPATSVDGFKTSMPSKLHITPLDIPQPPVPFLQYGLDRVLFNPGVYELQDQASRVYNFDPYLQNIMPNVEFDFDSLKEYKTSSKDEALAKIAKENGNKYIGSTSSMTSAMGHFHYLLSNWRPLNFGMLSNDFVGKSGKALPTQLTQINRAPTAIFLRWKNGTYAIDADKEHDSANVLMLLGKSMELMLTLPKSDFERYRKSDPREVPEEQRTAPESYQYTTMRDFLMRSQLDAYDPRLPGNGTFDLKTRAVVSVRMAADDHEPMTGYEIYAQQGKWGSYEKEYYDMMRSTMLKYMLQARMGRMNGIFVAYHNVERMFGFQYLPIADMDRALHGQTDPSLGDQEFRASLDMMNEVFNAATTKFPEQSLRIHFETREEEKSANGMPTALHVFAEPMTEEECDTIQNSQKAKIAEWEKTVMGKEDTAIDAEENADETASADVQDDVADNLAEDPDATGATAAEASTDNSTSNADPKFLNALAKADSAELKPLFYATIIAQSSVNGSVVERPQNLTAKDEWNIGYILKEYNTGRQQWAEYEDVKARRKMAYVREDEEEGVPKEENGYLMFLRNLSEKGRALRKEKDDREEGMPVVRVEDLDMERLETVESVEDYMRFLEKPKEKGTREMFG